MTDNIINLENLLDACNFKKLQDEVAFATQIAMITVDFKGKPVTPHSYCTEFCKKVRSTVGLKELCEKCDSRGGLEAARLQKPYIYICHMGLVDFAVPIFYNGFYLGAVMSGQLKLTTNDDMHLERILVEKSDSLHISREMTELYEALPRMSYDRIEALSHMIFYITNYIINEAVNKTKSVLAPSTILATLTNNSPVIHSNKNISTLKPAISYIDENFKNPITLTHMSSLCDISPSYFSKLFKKCYKYNLAGYVNRIRINEAKKLLLTTNKTVVIIAFELGYDDCGYFIKIFKALEGCTPNGFRSKS